MNDPVIRSAYDRSNPRDVRSLDNQALEQLATADGAILRALQLMPNSVHTAFSLPEDAQWLDGCLRRLRLITASVEEKHRQADREAGEHGASDH